jgi:hypothetical protein
MPRAVYASEAEIPPALKSEYEPKDGKFILKVEGELPGFVPEAVTAEQRRKLDEFRETNRTIMRELGVDSPEQAIERAKLYRQFTPAQLEKLKTVDPDEYARLKQAHDQLKGKGVESGDDVDAKIQAAVTKLNSEVVQPLQQKVEASEKKRAEAEQKLEDSQFRREITELAVNPKIGVRADALEFVISKAREVFTVKDGRVIAKPDQFSGSTGLPLGLEEWFSGLSKKFAFAFEQSSGGGGNGSGNGAGSPVRHGNTLIMPSGPADPKALAELSKNQDFMSGKLKIEHRGGSQ